MSKYDIHKDKKLPSDEEINKYKNFDKVVKKAAVYDYKQATKPIYKNVKVLSIVAVLIAVGLIFVFETTEQEEATEELIEQADTVQNKNNTPVEDTIIPTSPKQVGSIPHQHQNHTTNLQTSTTSETIQPKVTEENYATQTSQTSTAQNLSAEFKGGENALKTYLEKSIKYPYNAVESPYSGKVEVDLVIEKTGKIGSFTIYHSPNAAISREITRVIKMMPDWNAAVKNGNAAASTVTVYFPFKYLEEN